MDRVYVEPNRFVDSDHPVVRAFADRHARGLPPRQAAIQLYLAVRDGFRYSPWGVRFEPDAFKASAVLQRGAEDGAHCIDKALVLAAAARAVGIPSRLHFADVRNHIGTASLEAKLGTDLLVFHGYVGLHLGGRWVAATPAFNRELCVRLGVEPLAFDGVHDSVFQAYDRQAGQFMEYVTDRGHHAEPPIQAMFDAWREHYGASSSTGWPPSTRSGHSQRT